MSRSRACRSPSSWYLRRRARSLSSTARHPLRQADVVAVEGDVVGDRPEDAAQAERGAVVPSELLAEVERPHARLERAVDDGHRYGHLAGRAGGLEDGGERELQVLQGLNRQLVPERESAEDEVRDAMEVAVARQREPDLVAGRHRSAPRVPQLLLEVVLAPPRRLPAL